MYIGKGRANILFCKSFSSECRTRKPMVLNLITTLHQLYFDNFILATGQLAKILCNDGAIFHRGLFVPRSFVRLILRLWLESKLSTDVRDYFSSNDLFNFFSSFFHTWFEWINRSALAIPAVVFFFCQNWGAKYLCVRSLAICRTNFSFELVVKFLLETCDILILIIFPFLVFLFDSSNF